MKSFNYILSLLIISLPIFMGMSPAPSPQQITAEKHRTYLRDKLKIYYVNKLLVIKEDPPLLDNSAIQQGNFEGSFWQADHLKKSQKLVKALLLPKDEGGDNSLQYFAYRITKVINKAVIVYIIDDIDQTIGITAEDKYGICLDSDGKAWPCASNMTTHDDRKIKEIRCRGFGEHQRQNAIAGFMSIGTHYIENREQREVNGTFLHELTHTQDYSDWPAHQYQIGDVDYSYGADAEHNTIEAIPNLTRAYQEGLANTFELLYNPSDVRSIFRWFQINGHISVELPKHGFTSDLTSSGPCKEKTLPALDIWLFQQLQVDGVPEADKRSKSGGTEHAYYSIRDLPPYVVIRNEYIIAMTLFMQIKYSSLTKFMYNFSYANKQLYKEGEYGKGLAELFNALCTSGLLNKTTLASLLDGVDEDMPKPFLLPLALADYFTGFRSANKEEFLSMFEYDKRMSMWSDMYWPERNKIKGAVDPDSPQITDFGELAAALNIKKGS